MTATLKDNQARLAARMREIVALHDAGRAVSSVIDLDQVSRKIVDAVARTFDIQLAALWLVEGGAATSSGCGAAARARRADVVGALAPTRRRRRRRSLPLAAQVARTRGHPARRRRRRATTRRREAARGGRRRRLAGRAAARAQGARRRRARGRPRAEDARAFSEADFNLLTTFADQAAAAVENALLYEEVREASEELEKKVRLRTAELTAINTRARQGARRSARDPGAAGPVRAHGRARPAGRRRRARDQLADGGDPRLDRRPRRARSAASRGTARELGAAVDDAADGDGAITAYLEALAPAARRRAAADRRDGAAHGHGAARRSLEPAAAPADAASWSPPTSPTSAAPDEAARLADGCSAPRPGARPRGDRYADRPRLPAPHARRRCGNADRADPAHRRRAQELLAPRSAGDARARPICTKGSRRRSRCSHHALRDIVVDTTLRPRSARPGLRRRAQPGVDQSDPERGQQALGGKGTITIETEPSSDATTAGGVRARDRRRPGIAPEMRCRGSSSRSSRPSRRARAPASASASSRQIVDKHGGDAALRRPSPAAPCSRSGCRCGSWRRPR